MRGVRRDHHDHDPDDGIGRLAVFVDDRASGRFGDFLVSPIRRVELILGYLLSSFLISLAMTLVILVVGQVYLLSRAIR